MGKSGDKLIDRALQIALRAHAGQLRKAGDIPYVEHPVMVALKLAKYGFGSEVIAAALVHDVLEDTDFPESDLRMQLGDEVLAIVLAVTEDKTLPWEERMRGYIEQVRLGSVEAKAVSLADKIHNTESLIRAHHDIGADVWKLFSRGKARRVRFNEEMLAMLTDTWQHPILAEYAALIEQLRALAE